MGSPGGRAGESNVKVTEPSVRQGALVLVGLILSPADT